MSMMLRDGTLFPPPWLAFPELQRGSIGWRMGYGEDYLTRFFQWYHGLSEEDQTAYRRLFPEPAVWRGEWADEDRNWYFRRGEFWMYLWTEDGAPRYCKERLSMPLPEPPLTFWGHRVRRDGQIGKRCLSQWWPVSFRYSVQRFSSAEQYMMAEKASLFADEETRAAILACDDPAQIKTLGRTVRNFDPEVWDQAKYSIVLNGCYLKFSQNRDLRDYLLSTGERVLAEASPVDAVWGTGLAADNPAAEDPARWPGENLLGFALMEVRDELRRTCRNEALCDFSLAER